MTQLQNPFQKVPTDLYGEELLLSPEQEKMPLVEKIEAILGASDVVLFMKGNAQGPQCGFSANTVQILNTFKRKYRTLDILKYPDIRQGIKDYANWPTFPQLYVKKTLIGGNDIVTEMFESGELQETLGEN